MTAKQDDSEIHWSLTCPNSHAHCISKREKKESICYINPLHVHQNICMYLLHTVLYTSLTKMLTRRICLTIKSFFSWWLFPLLLWPKWRAQSKDDPLIFQPFLKVFRSSWILACGHFQKWPKNQGIVLALSPPNVCLVVGLEFRRNQMLIILTG